MILSEGVKERRVALDELFSFVKKDMKGTMLTMDTLPVTFRLLDPPLHEFVPQSPEKQAELAKSLALALKLSQSGVKLYMNLTRWWGTVV